MAVFHWVQKSIEALRRNPHRLLLALIDAAAVAVALWLAYQLRLDFHLLRDPDYWPQYLNVVVFVALGRIVVFYFFGLYKGLSRYAGMHEMLALFLGAATGSLLFVFCNYLSRYLPALGNLPLHPSGEHVLRIPWVVLGIEFFTTVVLVGGLRFGRRMTLSLSVRSSKEARRALIVGAGDAGELVARDLLKSPELGIRPVAFIDQDSRLWGRHIHGLPVVGHIHTLKQTLALYRVDEILIALSSDSPKLLREIVDECEKNHVTFKTVPSVKDLMEGKITVSAIRSVEIEDLLGREPVQMTLSADQNYLAGERVLITGAGGSIGSELCRQALACGPEELLLVGRGENSIHDIVTELAMVKSRTLIRSIIADIGDREKAEWIFATHRPTVVFHAAAHKHVPLMEEDPEEAIKNNVFGTYLLVRLSEKYEVKRFIFISTDKAVRPTSVMGASKRLAEMIVKAFEGRGKTRFMAVRFGNVLGSRGSVIPLFKSQIARGGPVTVTHPEVTRYFMTIPEAVSLVIQTGAIGKSGELLVLDMGQPVKIVELARNLITLSGFTPGEDIEIKFTGLRPGEKLYEEILTKGENVQRTGHGKIFITKTDAVNWAEIKNHLQRLEEYVSAVDRDGIRRTLLEAVPDYKPWSATEPSQSVAKSRQ